MVCVAGYSPLARTLYYMLNPNTQTKMKKITSLVLVLLTSMCSLTSWATDRVAPTMPTSVTPESGQSYYVFNTDAKLFMNYDIYSGGVVNELGTSVSITKTDGRGVQFQLGSNILNTWHNTGAFTAPSSSDYTYFSIAEVEDDTSLIQSSTNNPTYNETEYLGTQGNSTALKYNCSLEDNVHWLFFSVEDGQRYAAELWLYRALCEMDAYAERGFCVENYETLYADRANQTLDDLAEAAKSLQNARSLSTSYIAPWWNEVPILLSAPSDPYTPWVISSQTIKKAISGYSTYTIVLSATVNVSEPSTFFYGLDFHDGIVKIFVDDVQEREVRGNQINTTYWGSTLPNNQIRFYESLTPGTHTIKWEAEVSPNYNNKVDYRIRDLGVLSNNNLVSVDLLRPGSLGTEVLYQVNDVKDVRRLKVKGKMNDDDWAKLKMMSRLQELDLSEAEISEIPESQFQIANPDTTMQFLHNLILPDGLKIINDRAFYGSIIEELSLPSSLETIASEAFNRSHIRKLDMPDNLTNFKIKQEYHTYKDWFQNMYLLEKVKLSKNLKEIPADLFQGLYYLNDVVMPECLESIGNYAFYDTSIDSLVLPEGLKTIGSYAFYHAPTNIKHLPSTLTSIGEYAFQGSKIDSLYVPNSVTSIGNYAFSNCGLKYVELGAGCYSLASKVLSDNSETLKTLKLFSPSVAKVDNSDGTYKHPLSDIKKLETLLVPHYLWAGYKLDEYWYNAQNIVPFDYGNMDFIPIQSGVELGHERFGGCPSIELYATPSSLSIYGDMSQEFHNIKCNVNYSTGKYGMILNECGNVLATGTNCVSYYMDAKKWYFVSLPFDIEVNTISVPEGTQYAIRYYDGAGRAVNGKSGNWKNYISSDVILSGTGFIMQTNAAGWVDFYAADTENKYGTLRATAFNKTLAVNASETASNKGWNLVGNPYQCFYNNHALNFTAPITVWNGSTYTAYSLTDDDYAIRPNEAFFVQCPNEEYTTIGFPLQGRQLTSVIESQNAVKAFAPQAKTRQVVNVTVAGGEMEDMTRVVLNEEASMAYETSCDASKFMSMDSSVPQIYTLDAEGTQYAINERPFAEGFVSLGFYAGTEGSYTISSSRCDAEKVFITDNLTGTTTDITDGAYCFTAKAGTDNTRFTLSFVASDATAIKEIDKDAIVGKVDVYSVEGKFLGNDASRLGAGIYIVRQGKKTSKVIVR